MKAVVAHQVSKSFGELKVLDDAGIEVATGEVLAIIGPSGSGKSTLIRCLNLLETPDSGTVEILGDTVHDDRTRLSAAARTRLRLRVGMVFQAFNLFPNMTARENVSVAQVHALGRGRAEADRRSADLLDRVGLADRAGHYPAQLSGGQQQRVAIARALALDPEIMLFDEPTSAIDPELRLEVLRVMQDLAREGMTMVIVTHELRFAREVADQVAFFADGRVVEHGPPEVLLDRPSQERTQRFLAALNGAQP